MMLKDMPGLRAMKGNRPILTTLILRPQAAGNTNNPDPARHALNPQHHGR
jgi:hypothetical protein